MCWKLSTFLETLYNMGMVEQMIIIIQGPHDQHHEHVLNILLKMANSYPPALKDCQQEKYGLKETLESRKHYLQETDPEAYEVQSTLVLPGFLKCGQ